MGSFHNCSIRRSHQAYVCVGRYEAFYLIFVIFVSERMRAMIFSDWRQKSKGLQVSKTLLWEYDLTRFD